MCKLVCCAFLKLLLVTDKKGYFFLSWLNKNTSNFAESLQHSSHQAKYILVIISFNHCNNCDAAVGGVLKSELQDSSITERLVFVSLLLQQ